MRAIALCETRFSSSTNPLSPGILLDVLQVHGVLAVLYLLVIVVAGAPSSPKISRLSVVHPR
jgi:hypothetical protein